MVLSMAVKADDGTSKGAAIIGSSVAAIQAALTLAQMGVEVKLITDSVALDCDSAAGPPPDDSSRDQRFLWPLLLRASSHPLISLHTGTRVQSIEGDRGHFKIQAAQRPRYIHQDLCTSCGRCQAECSAKVTSLLRGQRITHSAIHTPVLDGKAVPSAYVIDKNGVAPCHAACPLGINVQGFVSLLASGKPDRALELISEAAPLSSILGRVCRHPCEDNCKRGEVDSPVFIRALHRYAADNASGDIKFTAKLPAKSREEKIGIVGSGPAGLTAAWELSRWGYSPRVFESHSVIGGMLATGIPRFRLPREVRERELEAIKRMDIDIRTGITVGRDVTFAYLKERGYRAFFLSIGAQLDSKLGIPGEDLSGVVDCMSLLLALNLRVDTFLGQNVVVIGDGNSAVDSARAAIRRNEGTVTMLSWTIPEEITAGSDEVEEALQEGVSTRYSSMPVEILGDAGRVTGVRCQRTRLTEEIMPNGQHRPEPIPGTDFVIEADHVVVAVGQSPNAAQLNMAGLAIDKSTGTVLVNPLTLETNIPGVFAGGDCVTGPNNVVEAMAAGLRAADSIDRYLRGRDLEAGRSLEPSQVAEIDIEAIEASPDKRASMPTIRARQRLSSFEETTTGLAAEVAQREAQRCLDCALCSQCMECTRVCELDAVFHDDATRYLEIAAEAVLQFPAADSTGGTGGDNHREATPEGIHLVAPDSDGKLDRQVMKAMAVARQTAIDLGPPQAEEIPAPDLAEADTSPAGTRRIPEQPEPDRKHTGVFLCRCGGAISSVIDFKAVARRLPDLPEVSCVREVAQACTEAGAREIVSQVAEWRLGRVVLAACRCCNLEQLCYSCTDRRIMCQEHLNEHLVLPRNTVVEFVNIREHCAWIHRDDPQGATRKAVQLISSGVARARLSSAAAVHSNAILPSALIVGGEPASFTAATALTSRGYRVDLVARAKSKQGHGESGVLRDERVTVKPWPDVLELHGPPGNYEAVLEYGSQVDRVPCGAVLVDVQDLSQEPSPLVNTTSAGGLLGRIVSRRANSLRHDGVADDFLRELTIGETSGIFLLAPDGAELPQDHVACGLAAAVRLSTFLEQASLSPRATAVNIDSRLCRGCGDCAEICPYIEMKQREDGTAFASVDRVLCLGCGACIAACPTGAISQPLQSDKHIISTVRSMLRAGRRLIEV